MPCSDGIPPLPIVVSTAAGSSGRDPTSAVPIAASSRFERASTIAAVSPSCSPIPFHTIVTISGEKAPGRTTPSRARPLRTSGNGRRIPRRCSRVGAMSASPRGGCAASLYARPDEGERDEGRGRLHRRPRPRRRDLIVAAQEGRSPRHAQRVGRTSLVEAGLDQVSSRGRQRAERNRLGCGRPLVAAGADTQRAERHGGSAEDPEHDEQRDQPATGVRHPSTLPPRLSRRAPSSFLWPR